MVPVKLREPISALVINTVIYTGKFNEEVAVEVRRHTCTRIVLGSKFGSPD
jgi:hypothetical protein